MSTIYQVKQRPYMIKIYLVHFNTDLSSNKAKGKSANEIIDWRFKKLTNKKVKRNNTLIIFKEVMWMKKWLTAKRYKWSKTQ